MGQEGSRSLLHLTGICPAAYSSYDPSQGKGSLPATPASPSQALLGPESRGVQASLMSNIITKVPKGSMLTSLLYGVKKASHCNSRISKHLRMSGGQEGKQRLPILQHLLFFKKENRSRWFLPDPTLTETNQQMTFKFFSNILLF